MTEDKFNITIRIAGQNPIALQINRGDEERVRNSEYQVNRLWGRWRERFPEKNSMEVLAMVAYQFADLFFKTSQTADEANTMLGDFEKDLDKMLHGFGADAAVGPSSDAEADNGKDAAEGKSSHWAIS